MNTKRGRNRGLPILFVVVMLLFLACSETDLVATGCEPSCLLGQACVDGVCTTDDVGAPLFDGVVQVNGGVDGGADFQKASPTVHVPPEGSPVPAVQAVLMPGERHSITGEFEVGLVDQLLHSG